jgi:membrane protein DedA with SNARE-associated domain/membrane-associated phospholipid phosphatase
MLREWVLRIPYIQYVGYVLAFFGAFLETLPGIGIFVPGQTIVVIAGFLAQQGVLHLWLVLLLAILGAILGDTLGYFLGRRYGLQLFRKQQGIVREVADIVHEHPFKTLVIGRFNSLTRAFAPFAAGASNVRPRSFFTANIIGGVLWGLCFVSLGYLFGASYEFVSHSVDVLIFVAASVFSAVLILYYYLKKHVGVSHRASALLVINITALVFFIGTLVSLLNIGTMAALDILVHDAIPTIRTPLVTAFMMALTPLRQVLVVSAAAAIVVVVLWKKNRRDALLFAITVVTGLVLDRALKELFMRVRPTDGLIPISLYSFPSGHAMLSVIFLGALVLTYKKYVAWKEVFVGACVLLAAIISFSRLYLGVHWLSDVLGGVFFGLFWLSFVFLVSELYDSYRRDVRKHG